MAEKKIFLPSFIFLLLTCGAIASGSTQDKLLCTKKDLTLKNCSLVLGKNHVQFWKDKILFNDHISRDIKNIQKTEGPGEATAKNSAEWAFIFPKKMKDRWFIEFANWSQPQGTAEVESLEWFVYEIKNEASVHASLELLLEKIIRKRKKISKDRYKYDKMIEHQWHLMNKKFVWSVGHEKGSL
ncbi:MAG: hypothetical protein ABL927_00630 [Bdellovibrionales bacterium]